VGISLDPNEIIKKVKELGPWVQYYDSDNGEHIFCHFCGCDKKSIYISKEEKHNLDCLWLEIEKQNPEYHEPE
jgi:hypothetical protein